MWSFDYFLLTMILLKQIIKLLLISSFLKAEIDLQKLRYIKKQISNHVGVYRLNNEYYMNKLPDLNNTVLVTASNFGYLNHLLNFNCYMQKLNFKFSVFSLDTNLHSFLRENHPSINSIAFFDNSVSLSQASNFRTKFFNVITNKKEETVFILLHLGFNVIFIDIDIALLKDPLIHLMLPRVDYVHAVNIRCSKSNRFDYSDSSLEGNTGLYYVKSTINTISLWRKALIKAKKYINFN